MLSVWTRLGKSLIYLRNICKVGLNPFPNKLWFLRICNTRFLKTLWEKEKLLVTSNFSFSQQVFYPLQELSAIFIEFEIVVCKLFQFNPLPDDKNLDWSKLKQFAEDNFKFDENSRKFS